MFACLVTYQWRLIPHLLQEKEKKKKTKLGQLASSCSVERKKGMADTRGLDAPPGSPTRAPHRLPRRALGLRDEDNIE
jgi:hypothetical protein